jgi:hypothetical protein
MKIIALILLLPSIAFARWNNSYDFQTWGVHDSIESDANGNQDVHDDSFSVLGAKLRYKKGIFVFSADPQLRALFSSSETTSTQPEPTSRPSIQAPRRGLKLESSVWGSPRSEAQASFERLTLGIKTKSAEFILGRQPFSLGVMKIVPIWNRFVVNLPLPGVFLQFPDQDGVSFRLQDDFWSVQAFAIAQNQSNQNAYLVENTFSFNVIDVRVLAGSWAQNLAAGLAFAMPVFGGTFRGEYLNVGLRQADPVAMNQFGLGYETAFSEHWSAVLETLYLSTGVTDELEYNVTQLNSFRPLLAQDYLVLQVKYDSGGFYSVQPQIVVNLIDGSAIVGAELNWSLGDHSEIALQFNIPTGVMGKEFSASAMPLASLGPKGTAQQVFLKYHLFY